MKLSVKCETRGCHLGKKVTVHEVALLRSESEREGMQAGLICPACVRRALANPDQYDLDMPLGELVVEAARETPRWRICFTPSFPLSPESSNQNQQVSSLHRLSWSV